MVPIAAALLLIALPANTQSAPHQQPQSPAPATVTGVWRGQIGGLPGATLVVSDEGGSLAGALLFYFQERKTVNDPWTSTPGLPEPMLRVHFDGRALTFQISHRRAHPPRTLSDPPVSIRLTLTGPDQAELVNENEQGPTLPMVRSDY
ncbi:MAG: hypothetical protein P4M04_05410 [Acidobacteriota bacterium]|nr:hypothetical protein [Acidobacteriota bacterium]